MDTRIAMVTILLICHVALPWITNAKDILQYEDAKYKINHFNEEYEKIWWLQQSTDWSYSTNMSNDASIARNVASVTFSNWLRSWKMWARTVDTTLLPNTMKHDIERMASGVVFLNENDSKYLTELKSVLAEMYSTVKVYFPENQIEAIGENEVTFLMGSLKDPELLKKIWKSWRSQLEKSKPYFFNLFHLTNKAAKENGYSDIGAVWIEELGLDNGLEDIFSLWNEVQDFYWQLHAYTKYKLNALYKDQDLNTRKWIPAHLLGSIWGENWSSLSDILLPFPEENSINITQIFDSRNFTVNDIAHVAEKFYTKMGFEAMDESFWKKSMLEKPKDGRLVDCHAASYDFANGGYRIRMCGQAKEKSYIETVHEFGHIEYFSAYSALPMMYRNGANSAFHESVGETLVYAAQNPFCLQKLDFIKPTEITNAMIVNALMKQALSKFVLLPWALSLETWRYQLFSDDINEQNMISEWWDLRKYYQGVEPPDEESSKFFDPGSKYHVLQNIPYMRYFLGRFLEHHFLKALCDISGEKLKTCCFITNKEAGERFRYMLSLGSSLPWKDAFESLTSTRDLSSKPLMEYYEPLYEWLKDFNLNHNITISWKQ